MHVEPLPVAAPAGISAPALSGALTLPADARALLVLAHGAGAGFRHSSMIALSEAFAAVAIATLRFNFPFTEVGKRRVDSQVVSVASVAAAAAAAAARLPHLPLYVGGHSFGGRMASHALAEGAIAARGLVCVNFPLHPAGRPDTRRAAHLAAVAVPMLFLSGTRDALAERSLLAQVVADLAGRKHDAGVRLHWLDDADHGYRVRQRQRQRQDPRSVFEEIADEVGRFVADTT